MFFIVDANVLIDFIEVDEAFLTLAVRHLGPIHVPRDVLDEVSRMDEARCDRLGLIIAEGTVEQLLEAGATHGPLSYYDRLCFILARDQGWTCVTNDRRLRRECEAFDVDVMWGLQMILGVLAAGGLDAASALELGEAVVSSSGWISKGVLQRFREEVAGR